MNKPEVIANVWTLSSLSMTFMDLIPLFTVLSLFTAMILNLILIYKNIKKKNLTKQ